MFNGIARFVQTIETDARPRTELRLIRGVNRRRRADILTCDGNDATMMTKGRPMARVMLMLVVIAGLTCDAGAADPFGLVKQPVEATLIANTEAIVPGQAFDLGVLFKIAPRWHTYWINPGDAGTETRIRITTPGFEADAVQWPLPKTINVEGFTSFGYEDRVLHIIRVVAPGDLTVGQTVTLSAHVEWQVCHNTCIDGNANLSIKLPVESAKRPANAKLFTAWREKLPIDLNSAAASRVIARVEQKTGADGHQAEQFTVTWRGDSPPKGVRWFPVATAAVAVEDVEASHEGNRTQVTYSAQVFNADKVGDGVIMGVLVFENPDGKRVGVNVPIRVLPARNATDNANKQ